MDIKIEVQEDQSLSDDAASQNELFTKNGSTLLHNCDGAIKTEIEADEPSPDFSSKNQEAFTPGDPIMMAEQFNFDPAVSCKIEIKEETWWLERDDNIEDGSLPSPKSSRLTLEDDTPNASTSTEASTSNKRSLHLEQESVVNKGKSGKRPYACMDCDKSYTRLSSLKIHKLIHEGKKPHQCKTCGRSFTQKGHLNRHILIHLSKKAYKCNICNKGISRFEYLKVHLMYHKGKRPYACKHCDKKFTQRSDLKKHNLIHEGKKPYRCAACDKSFRLPYNLTLHNRVHHHNQVMQK